MVPVPVTGAAAGPGLNPAKELAWHRSTGPQRGLGPDVRYRFVIDTATL